jgi:hypothetical protein
VHGYEVGEVRAELNEKMGLQGSHWLDGVRHGPSDVVSLTKWNEDTNLNTANYLECDEGSEYGWEGGLNNEPDESKVGRPQSKLRVGAI